jgi:hypothetical protein
LKVAKYDHWKAKLCRFTQHKIWHKHLTMKLLFKEDVYEDALDRIEKISADTKAKWGSMDAAQMMAHCSEIQEVSNGKALENTPFIARLFKGMIRKMVVNKTPYKRSTQTHPQYLKLDAEEFDASKVRLLNALAQFKTENSEGPSKHVHPLFGEMTHEEKGWGMYKHLDHHLSQFGV